MFKEEVNLHNVSLLFYKELIQIFFCYKNIYIFDIKTVQCDSNVSW